MKEWAKVLAVCFQKLTDPRRVSVFYISGLRGYIYFFCFSNLAQISRFQFGNRISIRKILLILSCHSPIESLFNWSKDSCYQSASWQEAAALKTTKKKHTKQLMLKGPA